MPLKSETIHDSELAVKVTAKVSWTGAIVNTLLATLKISIGFLADSQALVADGFHSLSDLITDGAVIIGARFWGMKYDEKHPYGHRRIETMVSFLIAMMLAGIGVGIAWQAVIQIQEEHSSNPGIIAFFAALVSIVAKEILYRWTLSNGKQINSKALVANAWHHRSDALSSVPVAVAVAGSYLFPSFNLLDHIAAVIVSVMLLKAAWDIAVPCVYEIMDARADKALETFLQQLENEQNELKGFHKVRSRVSGSAIFVDMHMLVDPAMSVENAHELTLMVEDKLRGYNHNIVDITIHVEPSQENGGAQTGHSPPNP